MVKLGEFCGTLEAKVRVKPFPSGLIEDWRIRETAKWLHYGSKEGEGGRSGALHPLLICH